MTKTSAATTATTILDRDLFVQAFWVKMREVVRPELDRAVERLRERDVAAEIASQEYDPSAGRAKESGPSLTLTAAGNARLSFYGDVVRQRVLVFAGRLKTATAYSLDQLDETEAKSILAAWEAKSESLKRVKEGQSA